MVRGMRSSPRRCDRRTVVEARVQSVATSIPSPVDHLGFEHLGLHCYCSQPAQQPNVDIARCSTPPISTRKALSQIAIAAGGAPSP